MELADVLTRLHALADPTRIEQSAKFGIQAGHSLGIRLPQLRELAKEIRKNHALAGTLWATGIHEARLMAAMIADPKQITEAQMEQWVADFDSWDVCDGMCSEVFSRTPYAIAKATEWAGRPEEYVKRAGFVLMADLAHRSHKTSDEQLAAFFPLMVREATDERNFVKKAVNWALRDIGKRNLALNAQAIATARQIQQLDSKSARWIAADALRELTSDKVQAKLHKQG